MATTTTLSVPDHLVLAVEALPDAPYVFVHEVAMAATDNLGALGERLVDMRDDGQAADLKALRNIRRQIKKIERVVELSNAGRDSAVAWKEIAKLHRKRPDLRGRGCECPTCQPEA